MDIDTFRLTLYMGGLLKEFDQLQAAIRAARTVDNDGALAQAQADLRAFHHRNPLFRQLLAIATEESV